MRNIRIKAERLRIRRLPSTMSAWTGEFAPVNAVLPVLETREAEGFIWARIGEDKWIATYEGLWTEEAILDWEAKYHELAGMVREFLDESLKATESSISRLKEKIEL